MKDYPFAPLEGINTSMEAGIMREFIKELLSSGMIKASSKLKLLRTRINVLKSSEKTV